MDHRPELREAGCRDTESRVEERRRQQAAARTDPRSGRDRRLTWAVAKPPGEWVSEHPDEEEAGERVAGHGGRESLLELEEPREKLVIPSYPISKSA